MPRTLALTRPTLLALLAALLLATSCGSCGSCADEEKKAPAQPDISERADVVEDTRAEMLDKAREQAEELGESVGFTRTEHARFLALELEGTQKRPAGPRVKTGPKSKDTGQIDVAAVQRVFKKHHGALQKCYERALKRDPALQGKVVLSVRIGGSGEPTFVKAKSGAIRDRGALDCMEREAKGWLFPRPRGGTVMINKPLRFTPQN